MFFKNKISRTLLVAFSLGCAAASMAPRAHGAESGTGAYVLGIRGAGAGITPPEGLFFSNQVFVYRGGISGRLRFEGGSLVARARVSPLVNVPTLVWITPLSIGDARIGTSVTVPFGEVKVRGSVGPFSRSDRTFAVADPSVAVFLGGRSGNLHWQAGATAFLPIGDYRRGALANAAKHRGALDLYGALTWLVPEFGLDVTNVVGVTFNTPNTATKYRTGTEFHWEWAITRKFENNISVGPVGYVYQQLTGDSGAGAVLGPFKGEVAAIGGSLGYDFKLGAAPVSARLRVYHEFHARNRLKGNAAFLALSMPLWVPGAR